MESRLCSQAGAYTEPHSIFLGDVPRKPGQRRILPSRLHHVVTEVLAKLDIMHHLMINSWHTSAASKTEKALMKA